MDRVKVEKFVNAKVKTRTGVRVVMENDGLKFRKYIVTFFKEKQEEESSFSRDKFIYIYIRKRNNYFRGYGG